MFLIGSPLPDDKEINTLKTKLLPRQNNAFFGKRDVIGGFSRESLDLRQTNQHGAPN
ncbi:hypothetical protein NBRC3257_2894 [Gluconobacter thailandicus NBRC 3257]|uniref:Uncharacterized protein n=1 Tax=Gluconobacter thailandicus NBRC 3257 TaxID=1381097 RepID=A0ABQ0J0C6_GLUTH|nr:hypothetical protein B932_2724 [Gluconobacter oxydans H24]GAC86709.1 hypothetical protein NBRC3255_0370 [Gluconobacter thailandicus NBRC 3255]GAD27895.1 hypothetical protein NBRC3257_2894 [Gluconobacter thailandicus NBRC 3257]